MTNAQSVRSLGGFALGAGGIFGSMLVGALIVRSPFLALAIVGLVGLAALYTTAPQVPAYLAIFMAFAALPSALPTAKLLFGTLAIYAHEVLILVAIAFLIPLNRGKPTFAFPAVAYTSLIMVSVALGLLNRNDTSWIFQEARHLLMMVAGYVLAILIIGAGLARQTVTVVAITLWYSAFMVIFGKVAGVPVRGRNEGLTAVTGAGVSGITRVVTWANTLALAVMVALLVMAILGRVRLSTFLALGVPAIIVNFLSFSRNPLIALSFAAVVTVMVSMRRSTVRRVFVATTVSLALAVTIVAAAELLRSFGVGWIAEQVRGYAERVVGGLTVGVSRDASLQDRLIENRRLVAAINNSPVFGHGFGYAYQAFNTVDKSDFARQAYRPFFSHNFYLWLLAKTGVVGVAAFLWFTLQAVVKGVTSASLEAKASAIVAASMLVVSVVWPIPELTPDSIVLGLALGAAVSFAGSTSAANSAPVVRASATRR